MGHKNSALLKQDNGTIAIEIVNIKYIYMNYRVLLRPRLHNIMFASHHTKQPSFRRDFVHSSKFR